MTNSEKEKQNISAALKYLQEKGVISRGDGYEGMWIRNIFNLSGHIFSILLFGGSVILFLLIMVISTIIKSL
jgi:hypothetical protein